MEKDFRRIQLVHFAFIGTWLLFLLMFKFLPPIQASLPLYVPAAMGFACLTDVTIGFVRRASHIAQATEILRNDPENRAGLAKWRVANIVSFAFAETATLFGFILRLLGTSWNIAGIFYGIGLLLLILWTPRKIEALPRGVS